MLLHRYIFFLCILFSFFTELSSVSKQTSWTTKETLSSIPINNSDIQEIPETQVKIWLQEDTIYYLDKTSTPLIIYKAANGTRIREMKTAESEDQKCSAISWIIYDPANKTQSIWAVFVNDEEALSPKNLMTTVQPESYLLQPTIALDSAKNAALLWLSYDASTNQSRIVSSIYRQGAWSDTSELFAIEESGSFASNPKIVLNPKGDGAAIWRAYDHINKSYSIHAATYSSGSFSPSSTLYSHSCYGGSTISPPLVAIDDKGHAVALWKVNNALLQQQAIRASSFIGGIWQGSTLLFSTVEEGSQITHLDLALNPLTGNGKATFHNRTQEETLFHTINYIFTEGVGIGVWDTYEPPTSIETMKPSTEAHPQLIFDKAGKGVALWEVYDNASQAHAYMTSHLNDDKWKEPTVLHAPTSLPTQFAVNQSGQAVAIWKAFNEDDENHEILSANCLEGSSPTTSLLTSVSTQKGNASDPQIAISPEGRGVAIWKAYHMEMPQYSIESALFDGTSWSQPTSIFTVNALDGFVDSPQISFDSHDTAIALWKVHHGTSRQISLQEAHLSNGSWSLPTTLSTIPSENGSSIEEAKMAMMSPGKMMAIWKTLDSTTKTSSVLAAMYADGNFSPPMTLATISIENQSFIDGLQIATNAQDMSVASWHIYDGTNNVHLIQASNYLQGSFLQTPITLSALIGCESYAKEPTVQINAPGTAICSWNQYDMIKKMASIESATFCLREKIS